MKFEIKGTVAVVNEAKQVSDRFTKREFVLTVSDGRYDQTLLFELANDKCSLVDGVTVGEEINVHFNIRGREWKSPSGEIKYFTSLSAWKIDRTVQKPAAAPASNASTPAPTGYGGASADPDDIPFASCDLAYEPSPIARVLR